MKTLLCIFTILYGFIGSASAYLALTSDEKNRLLQGEVILRDKSTKEKEGRTFEAIGLIEATVNEVYQVLTKFEDYSDFMPHVRKVEILEPDTESAKLNYTLGLPLGIIKKYRLSMTFQSDESTAMLEWKKIDWPGLKENETIKDTTGYWLVKNYPEKEGYVIAVYHLYTDPGHISWAFKWIVDILSKNSVCDVVKKTRARVYDLYKK